MFGFGKEKINYLSLVSRYEASCVTFKRKIETAIVRIDEYENFNDAEEDIEIAIQYLARQTMRMALPESEKEEFMIMAKAHDLKIYMNRENRRFNEVKDYLRHYFSLEDPIAEQAQGKPNRSTLAGVLMLLKVDQEKIQVYLDEIEHHFPIEVIQGAFEAHQSFLKNKKIVGDNEDKELIDWLKKNIPDEPVSL